MYHPDLPRMLRNMKGCSCDVCQQLQLDAAGAIEQLADVLAFCAGGILPFLILAAGVAYVCTRIVKRVLKTTP